MTNGTLSMRAKVCASSVLPEPVGPTSSMSSFLPRCFRRLYWLYTATDRMRLAVCWPITYWSSNSLISCGVGRSDLAPVTDSMAEVSSRMMSLHRSMHSSQMKTDGPAISFFTSCWLLPQNEQYSNFSPLEDFLSDMGQFSLGYWLGRACRVFLAGGLVCSREKPLTASMLPEIKTKRPNVSASGRFLA